MSTDQPGANGNPLGPSFRDGPRREPDPHALRRFLLGLVPVLVLVAVLFFTHQV